MKRQAVTLLAMVFAICSLCGAAGCKEEFVDSKWDDDGVLKILTIGNSFSDDAMQWVYDIAESAGVKVYLGNLYIGGCSLETHLLNAQGDEAAYNYRVNSKGIWRMNPYNTMYMGIEDQDWDYISFQQVSGLSGIKDSYNPSLDSLLKLVSKKANKTAKFVWHMTWAYQNYTGNGDFLKYNRDQMYMYEQIVDAVTSVIVPNKKFQAIIPSGTAIQNARTAACIGDTITRDGCHLSLDLGRYVAGLALFGSLSGVSLDKVTFVPEGVTEEERVAAVRAASAAVEKPLEVTSLE